LRGRSSSKTGVGTFRDGPHPLVSYLQYFAYEPRQTSDRFK
jgi:hypothetical protein